MMKTRFFFILALVAVVVPCRSQTKDMSSVLASMGSVTVEFALSDVTGFAEIQGNLYKVVSSDWHIYGNGSDMWMYNLESDEMIISKNDVMDLFSSCNVRDNGSGKMTISYTDGAGEQHLIKVNSIVRHSQRWPESHFVPDMNSLGDDVVVTDLRKKK